MRNGNVQGTENLLYEILDKHNIKKQNFHGGAMNRVCSCQLLGNVNPIFNKIQKLMSDKFDQKKSLMKDKRDLHTNTLEIFCLLFGIMDIVFACQIEFLLFSNTFCHFTQKPA